jgi:A1 cistron-splicing factor AAR2
VSFLIGQVFDAFEQWKALVTLLCSCDEALAAHSELFSHFVGV